MSSVEVRRGGVVESRHTIHLACVDSRGELLYHSGDPQILVYSRSTLKPIQCLPLVLRGGLERMGVQAEEIAVASGSHSAEEGHLRAVLSLLSKAKVDPAHLQLGPHPPLGGSLSTKDPSPLHNNCSGKHASFLAAAVLGGEPLESYLDRNHPVQKEVERCLEELSGLSGGRIRWGIDGCGAPTAALPLEALARCWARLGKGEGKLGEAGRTVLEAMVEHAWFVGGTDRLDTRLMEACEKRIVSKAGAEGVHCVRDLWTGSALALKVEDGSSRAVAPALLEALRALGWIESRALDLLGDLWRPPIFNTRGEVVGSLEPRIDLRGRGSLSGGAS